MRGPTTDWMSQLRWWPCRNNSGETVPASGVMLIDGFDADTGTFIVIKPDADELDPSMLLINAPVEILASADGQGTFEGPVPAKITGTLVNGDGCGTEENQWHLAPDQRGFKVYGSSASGKAIVRPVYRALVGVACVNNQLVGDFLEDTSGGDDLRPVVHSLDFRWTENSMYVPVVMRGPF